MITINATIDFKDVAILIMGIVAAYFMWKLFCK